MEDRPQGLTASEAAQRYERLGPNVIFTAPPVTFLSILWEEVREPMILLLLTVGVLYSLLGEPADAVTIFVVILLLTLAEVQNEFRAKRAIRSLSEIAVPRAHVVRDGQIVSVDAATVVPDDVLVLSTGTKVAADATVVSTVGLQVDESPLTGESEPVDKPVGQPVFAGTTVVGGDGLAAVTATGKATRIGQLAEALRTVKPPRTPLQLAMRELAAKLVWVAVAFSVAIPVLGVLRGMPLGTMVLTGLSLAFATIPEEMPIIVTMVLGLGAYRLSQRAFLVKRLAAAETMGSVNVIATDKTGTLTESLVKLTSIYKAPSSGRSTDEDAVRKAMGAVLELGPTPIDAALLQRASEMGVGPERRRTVRKRDLGDGSKTRAVLREGGWLVVSGAPETVFGQCEEVPAGARAWLQAEAARGSRVIAVATRQVARADRQADWPALERHLELGALLAFSDPPRPEVGPAIRAMRGAGVRTLMVTGDHPATAATIAAEVGIDVASRAVIVGPELDAMDDAQLRQRLADTQVFARTTPQHKYRIVRLLQESGSRVAVTGDGINDALAIRQADVGVAMGIKGTDVAKEAADAILADDNYATIANAVFEGRVFYDNLRKGVKYYLSVKAALVGVFLLPGVLGLPLPFSPVQIIVLELFMDLAASAGFVAEPGEPDTLTRRPEAIETRLLDGPQVRDILLKGAFLFLAVMAAYTFADARHMGAAQQRSLAFAAWMVGHVALAFVSRSDRQPLLRVGLLSNKVVNGWALATAAFLCVGLYLPAIGARLSLVPLPLPLVLAMAALIVVWMGLLEARKYLRPRVSGISGHY
jgi:Ca2+-transporting ATPase